MDGMSLCCCQKPVGEAGEDGVLRQALLEGFWGSAGDWPVTKVAF